MTLTMSIACTIYISMERMFLSKTLLHASQTQNGLHRFLLNLAARNDHFQNDSHAPILNLTINWESVFSAILIWMSEINNPKYP